jgi:hypothetical protein
LDGYHFIVRLNDDTFQPIADARSIAIVIAKDFYTITDLIQA